MGVYKQGNIFWVSKCIDGVLYRKSTGTASKMESKAFYESWVAELKEQIRTGKTGSTIIKREPAKQTIFAELADKYKEWITGRQKSARNKSYLINELVKKLGNLKLIDFSVELIEKLQTDLLKEKSIVSSNRTLAILQAMFTKALDWELIDDEALRKVRKVKLLKGEIKRLRYLSDDEADRLINNCESYLRPIVVTALNTGMRKSEILHLTWDRVDLKNRIILLDITKNGNRREVPINNTLFNALSGLIRNIKIDYLFYNPDTLKPYYDIKKSFAAALRKSHILDFHFHDLRHTFASRLVMSGVDLASIQKLLGHKDIKMTLRYAHLSNTHLKDAVNILDKKDFHNSFIVGENLKINNP
jgi:integrase